jgi:putative IMPACT (imprinted ancient) family translation regulator
LIPVRDKTFYYTIEKPSIEEFRERGSKFIAYAYPIETTDDFKKLLQNLKKRASQSSIIVLLTA